MEIAVVEKSDAAEIAKLAVCLTSEIMERTGVTHFDIDEARATELCRNYLRDGQYQVVAASDRDRMVGFAALCESYSLYAEGSFGIVQEFYVVPEYRSRNIGSRLIDRMVDLARAKGWKRLELCTPPVPAFDRAVAFYRANGFEVTGGYKMKRAIT
ncbi:GNAT family N-acetyltransferase [Microbulbifer rhizosphaerae]|uniref:GNAT superfamily N-acetyltransferase n=1 Tax=Microbulbifer rhizosphaerae TaxID=1562603 RepID=A0A7W4Z8W5_9GAMM|nr:GNAT family N-acetyltransferase [Microbulbifer rhizosphaerae]MBB3061017.1 GNAT superfamily N-acetyltransferase [Microbulbifer rhizosphaerae]